MLYLNNVLILLVSEIVLFRPMRLKSKFEDSKIVYSGSASRSSIEKFIEENM